MSKAKVVRILDNDEFEEVERDHPWNQLLRNPVPGTHTEDFWQWVSLSRDLLGHSHSLVSGFTRLMGARLPKGFLPIYSEFGDLNPVPNAQGGVEAWEYLRADGHKRRYDPEEVLAIRRTSPFNPYKTMSLIQAAIYELDVDLFMKIYRADSVKDGGITSPLLGSDQPVNQTQRDQLTQEFKQYMGKRGIGKVAALSHGFKPLKIGMDARDLQYIEGNVQNGHELRFITGIPEALFSKDANRAVLEGAERVMVQYTIQPLVNGGCKQLTQEFERIFGADPGALMVMPPDLTPIDEELEIKRRESYLRTGQRTIDEYRQKDSKDEYEEGIGSVPLVSISQMPLKEVVTLNDTFEQPEEDDEDRLFRMQRGIKKKSIDKDTHWRVIDRHKRREEKRTIASVNHVFDRFQEIALANINKRRSVRAEQPILSIEQILTLIDARTIVDEELRDDIIRIIREGFRRGAFNAKVEGLEFQLNTPQVRNLLRDIARETRGIADTTIDQLSDAIKEGLENNESLDELAKRVKGYFKNAKATRTEMIAQTMATSGFEGGQLVSFKQAGITHKDWLSQRDGRQRETHIIADQSQSRVPINEKFQVGASKLMHPGDPNGEAKEVIRCRCSMLPVIKEEE